MESAGNGEKSLYEIADLYYVDYIKKYDKNLSQEEIEANPPAGKGEVKSKIVREVWKARGIINEKYGSTPEIADEIYENFIDNLAKGPDAPENQGIMDLSSGQIALNTAELMEIAKSSVNKESIEFADSIKYATPKEQSRIEEQAETQKQGFTENSKAEKSDFSELLDEYRNLKVGTKEYANWMEHNVFTNYSEMNENQKNTADELAKIAAKYLEFQKSFEGTNEEAMEEFLNKNPDITKEQLDFGLAEFQKKAIENDSKIQDTLKNDENYLYWLDFYQGIEEMAIKAYLEEEKPNLDETDKKRLRESAEATLNVARTNNKFEVELATQKTAIEQEYDRRHNQNNEITEEKLEKSSLLDRAKNAFSKIKDRALSIFNKKDQKALGTAEDNARNSGNAENAENARNSENAENTSNSNFMKSLKVENVTGVYKPNQNNLDNRRNENENENEK